MELDAIERYLELMKKYDVAELEIEGLRLRMDQAPRPMALAPAQAAQPGPQAAPAPSAVDASPADGVLVKSPMVGTFYRAPKPGAPPFVEVGDVVSAGQVLCIVEAMKLMNEIESEQDGVVAEIRAENGQPLQFGQVLFRITPS